MEEKSEKAGLKLNIKKKKKVRQKLRSWHPVPSQYGKQKGRKWKQCQVLFSGLQNNCRLWLLQWDFKMLTPQKESCDKLWWHIKKQSHHFADKGPSSQSYGFSSSHNLCENWTIKKAEH